MSYDKNTALIDSVLDLAEKTSSATPTSLYTPSEGLI